MSSCHTPLLESTEELLKVCYRKGYNRAGSRWHAGGAEGRAASFLERAGEEDARRGIFGRSMREVALGLGGEEGKRKSRRQRDYACPEFLVFVGSRGSLLQAIELTDYAPAAWWVPMGLPHVLEQLLAYTFSVSAALALLNMAPVYGLDGEAALRSLFQLETAETYLRGTPSRMRGGLQAGRRFVLLGVLNIGTAIFAFLLALHVLRMTGYDALLMRLLATVRHLLTFSVRWG